MFQVNDTVLYGSQSVCIITDITEQKIGKEKIRYYALKPVFDHKSTIYVPCSNQKLVEKMRRILSSSEIYELIDSLQNETLPWIEDDARLPDFLGREQMPLVCEQESGQMSFLFE